MRLIPAFVPVALLLGISGCDEPDDAPAEPAIWSVRTTIVTDMAEAERRTFSGVLTAAETMRLGFPVAGRLLEVPFREGESITAGEVVARLDPSEVEREIAAAEARVAAALGRLEAADGEFRRQNALFERGLIARAAFERASAEVTTARSELRLAETELSGARERLDRVTLVAPRDGAVTKLLANRFEEIAVGAPVYEVAVTADLQAEVLAPERLIGTIGPETRAVVRLPAFPGAEIPARVSEIASDVEAGNAFRVKARLENPPAGAKTGLSASVTFELPRRAQGLVVPLSALVFSQTSSAPTAGDAASVYVFDPVAGRVGLRAIRIDGVAGNEVLVTDGLEPGEHVVTAGVALLDDGQRARLWSLPE